MSKDKNLIWIESKNGKRAKNSGDTQSFVRSRMKYLNLYLICVNFEVKNIILE